MIALHLRPVCFAFALLVGSAALAGQGDRIFFNGFEDGANHPPVLAEIPDQAGVLGAEIRIEPVATDPDPGDVLSWTLLASPSGMSIDPASGVMTWTPLPGQVGPHAVSVRVSDRDQFSTSRSFEVSVIAAISPPLITSIADQVALVDTALQIQVELANPGAGTPLAFSLDQAPAGMQIDLASGLIAWTPTSADVGMHEVIVAVINSAGQMDTEPFAVQVVLSAVAPVVAPIADQHGKPGIVFRFAVQATDADGDALNFWLATHPPGMSIDADSGEISWLPALQHLGPHPVEVRASDPLGLEGSASFAVFISQNRAPQALDDAFNVERGDSLLVPAPGLLVNDSDPDADPLTAVLVSGPSMGVLDYLNADGAFGYTPDNPVGTIGFSLKWAYREHTGVPEFIPLVIDLDGDDIPELVGVNAASSTVHVHAVHGDTGLAHFDMNYGWSRLLQNHGMAAADIDLDGHPEIIFISGDTPVTGTKLIALDHTGQVKWVSERMPNRYFRGGSNGSGGTTTTDGNLTGASISIADVDQDGMPEILVGTSVAGGFSRIGYQVFDNQGNKLDSVSIPRSGSSSTTKSRVEVVDLDLDGDPEIVVGSAAWSHDGQLQWQRADLDDFRGSHYPTIANLDDDPYPELVRKSAGGQIVALNHDGSDLWDTTFPFNSNIDFGIMTIADVDNDGNAEVIVPGDNGSTTVRVLNGADGTIKWTQTVPGIEGNWGATVFDMDNDGFNEVIFLNTDRLIHVWDGRDGSVKLTYQTGETGRATQISLPIFADVDNDGHAEMVTIGAYTGSPDLLRVYESPNDDWPPMRAIWNQDNYHVTNINDDGTVPRFERPHWLLSGLNQSRINQRLPEQRLSVEDSFTYRISDGALQSEIATVNLLVLPPNSPPRILSDPRLLASPGFEYVYTLLAVDADVGEVLDYALTVAPTGMVLDANHVLRWTPSGADIGAHPVTIRVTDSLGVAVWQNFSVTVTGAVTVPAVTGLGEAAAIAAISAATLIADPVATVHSNTVPPGQVAAQSPSAGSTVGAGSAVRIDVSKGPMPIAVPKVLGLRLADAQQALLAAGLGIGTLSYVNDAGVALGSVRSQDPAPRIEWPPGAPVDLVISGGPRALIEVSPRIIPAGASAQVTVSVHDDDGTLLDPQPAIALSLDVQAGEYFGTPPILSGNVVQTGADSQGRFRVVAAFNTGTPESIGASIVAMQPLGSGESASIFSEFADQVAQFAELLPQIESAVAAGDGAAIIALDAQLVALGEAIDTRRLRTTTPLALEGGVAPTPEIAAANGFGPGADDAAYSGATRDLIPLLQAIENTLADPGTPPAIERFLNQQLAESGAAVAQLDVGLHGVLKSSSAVVNVIGTRLPSLVVADIDRVHRALVDFGWVDDGASARQGSVAQLGFSFPALMSGMQIRTQLIKDIYVPYLSDIVRAMGTIIAADLLQNFANNTAVTGIISGSSIAIHIFELPNSVIEGFGFDNLLPEGNSVVMVGPELIDAVIDIINQDLPAAEDFKDLNDINDAINEQIELAGAATAAFENANSAPTDNLRGCLFDAHPACRQLVYPDGFKSVYQSTAGLNLPAPVIIIVNNLGPGGGMGVFVANFVPTREEEE
jgi:hypothetical protein